MIETNLKKNVIARIKMKEKENNIRTKVDYIASITGAETFQYNFNEYNEAVLDIRLPKKAFKRAVKMELWFPMINIMMMKE